MEDIPPFPPPHAGPCNEAILDSFCMPDFYSSAAEATKRSAARNKGCRHEGKRPCFFAGYCEEDIESMESLCNMIAGDAPLYTMFRKAGDLVKCPFRGPFSFSYSRGGRGQVCAHPPSYLDSCGDDQKMRLKYQACLDVEGSEVASEYAQNASKKDPLRHASGSHWAS